MPTDPRRLSGWEAAGTAGFLLLAGGLLLWRQQKLVQPTLVTSPPASTSAPAAPASAPVAPPTADVGMDAAPSAIPSAVKPSTPGVKVDGAPIEGVERTIGLSRRAVRGCYEQGLASNPDMEGRVLYTIEVAPDGRAAKVTTTASGSLSQGVTLCIKKTLLGLTFQPPGGGGASTLSGQFNFVFSGKGK